jgi:peptidase E
MTDLERIQALMRLFKRKPKPQPNPRFFEPKIRTTALHIMDLAKALTSHTLCNVIWASVDDKHDLYSQDVRALAQKLDRKADQLERVESARMTS